MSHAHEILGLRPGAGPDEVRRAYRRALLANHPDRHPDDPGASERLRGVIDAYRELTGESPAGETFRPLHAAVTPRISSVRLPLAHAVRGAELSVSIVGGRLSVRVPEACGEGVVIEGDRGLARIGHLVPVRFRLDRSDLVLGLGVATTGPEAGRLSFLGADDRPVEMSLGPSFPRRIRLEGAGAPLPGRVGVRGDLVLVLSPFSPTAPDTSSGAARRVDVLA